jgi:tetratricopeptide (TPR) repeat protein
MLPSHADRYVHRHSRSSLLRRLDEVLPRKLLKWGAYVLLAVLLAGSAVYRSSIPGKALNNYNDAKRLYETGKYSNALYAANEALRDRGLRLKVYHLRAEIYRALQQPKEAVPDITRVIGLQPDVLENYSFRAQVYMELGDPASAAQDYTKIVVMKGSADAYNDRGLCYLKLNDPQRAMGDFEKAIQLEPRAEFYFQLAMAQSAVGNPQQAILNFDRALESQPGLVIAVYSYRARAAEKQKLGDTAGSAADMEKALAAERVNSLGGASRTKE